MTGGSIFVIQGKEARERMRTSLDQKRLIAPRDAFSTKKPFYAPPGRNAVPYEEVSRQQYASFPEIQAQEYLLPATTALRHRSSPSSLFSRQSHRLRCMAINAAKRQRLSHASRALSSARHSQTLTTRLRPHSTCTGLLEGLIERHQAYRPITLALGGVSSPSTLQIGANVGISGAAPTLTSNLSFSRSEIPSSSSATDCTTLGDFYGGIDREEREALKALGRLIGVTNMKKLRDIVTLNDESGNFSLDTDQGVNEGAHPLELKQGKEPVDKDRVEVAKTIPSAVIRKKDKPLFTRFSFLPRLNPRSERIVAEYRHKNVEKLWNKLDAEKVGVIDLFKIHGRMGKGCGKVTRKGEHSQKGLQGEFEIEDENDDDSLDDIEYRFIDAIRPIFIARAVSRVNDDLKTFTHGKNQSRDCAKKSNEGSRMENKITFSGSWASRLDAFDSKTRHVCENDDDEIKEYKETRIEDEIHDIRGEENGQNGRIPEASKRARMNLRGLAASLDVEKDDELKSGRKDPFLFYSDDFKADASTMTEDKVRKLYMRLAIEQNKIFMVNVDEKRGFFLDTPMLFVPKNRFIEIVVGYLRSFCGTNKDINAYRDRIMYKCRKRITDHHLSRAASGGGSKSQGIHEIDEVSYKPYVLKYSRKLDLLRQQKKKEELEEIGRTSRTIDPEDSGIKCSSKCIHPCRREKALEIETGLGVSKDTTGLTALAKAVDAHVDIPQGFEESKQQKKSKSGSRKEVDFNQRIELQIHHYLQKKRQLRNLKEAAETLRENEFCTFHPQIKERPKYLDNVDMGGIYGVGYPNPDGVISKSSRSPVRPYSRSDPRFPLKILSRFCTRHTDEAVCGKILDEIKECTFQPNIHKFVIQERRRQKKQEKQEEEQRYKELLEEATTTQQKQYLEEKAREATGSARGSVNSDSPSTVDTPPELYSEGRSVGSTGSIKETKNKSSTNAAQRRAPKVSIDEIFEIIDKPFDAIHKCSIRTWLKGDGRSYMMNPNLEPLEAGDLLGDDDEANSDIDDSGEAREGGKMRKGAKESMALKWQWEIEGRAPQYRGPCKSVQHSLCDATYDKVPLIAVERDRKGRPSTGLKTAKPVVKPYIRWVEGLRGGYLPEVFEHSLQNYKEEKNEKGGKQMRYASRDWSTHIRLNERRVESRIRQNSTVLDLVCLDHTPDSDPPPCTIWNHSRRFKRPDEPADIHNPAKCEPAVFVDQKLVPLGRRTKPNLAGLMNANTANIENAAVTSGKAANSDEIEFHSASLPPEQVPVTTFLVPTPPKVHQSNRQTQIYSQIKRGVENGEFRVPPLVTAVRKDLLQEVEKELRAEIPQVLSLVIHHDKDVYEDNESSGSADDQAPDKSFPQPDDDKNYFDPDDQEGRGRMRHIPCDPSPSYHKCHDDEVCGRDGDESGEDSICDPQRPDTYSYQPHHFRYDDGSNSDKFQSPKNRFCDSDDERSFELPSTPRLEYSQAVSISSRQESLPEPSPTRQKSTQFVSQIARPSDVRLQDQNPFGSSYLTEEEKLPIPTLRADVVKNAIPEHPDS